jgi:hypothetical protein
MAVIISGHFSKLTCRIKTMMPLDWGAVGSDASRSMDFSPLTLSDTSQKRMDFGWLPKANDSNTNDTSRT